MNRRLYALHRWISAAAFLQLAVWTLTGSFFAIVPIERVRGGPAPGVEPLAVSASQAFLSPADILGIAQRHGVSASDVVELRTTGAGTFYVVRERDRGLRFDARTGALAPVSEAEAREVAQRDQPGRPAVLSASPVNEAPVEYRGKPVPAWRVALDDGRGTIVYVDATSAQVTARRSDLWRVYDFLWSLHIMDYRDRESFNHPLLIGAAALALLTVATGLTLWVLRFRRWLAARRSASGPPRGGDA